MIVRAGALIALLAAAAPGFAQDRGGRASDRALAPLVACRPIADVRARAACYDAALDKLQQSVAERNVVVMDREQVKEDRKTTFGFSSAPPAARIVAPKPAKTPRAAAMGEEVTSIDSTVVAASPYDMERWTIRIATGATWRTTEAGIVTAPKAGTPVQIRRGAIGSFMLRIGNGRAMRAIRVR